MRQLTIIILLTFGLSSCDKTVDNTGYDNSITFFNKYTDSFLKSELLKYDYNPRTQYSFSINDTLIYRALIRHEENQLVGVFYKDNGFEVFKGQFKLPVESKTPWERLSLKCDSLDCKLELESYEHSQLILNRDTINGDIKTIGNYSIPNNLMNDLIKYFTQLDKKRTDYGIIDYRKLRIGGILEVNFSATDYLLYFPNDMKIEEKRFQDFWDKKIKEGKKLNDNWYYYKRERPMDNG